MKSETSSGPGRVLGCRWAGGAGREAASCLDLCPFYSVLRSTSRQARKARSSEAVDLIGRSAGAVGRPEWKDKLFVEYELKRYRKSALAFWLRSASGPDGGPGAITADGNGLATRIVGDGLGREAEESEWEWESLSKVRTSCGFCVGGRGGRGARRPGGRRMDGHGLIDWSNNSGKTGGVQVLQRARYLAKCGDDLPGPCTWTQPLAGRSRLPNCTATPSGGSS